MLDSFVASVDIFDEILLKKRKDGKCLVTMKGLGSESIPTEKNNAYKAAVAFCERYGVGGAEITVHKNIPMGAGLGGSSADIAGVLNGLAKLYGVDDEKGLDDIAASLGSDSKYMRKGGFARMQGRGNDCYYLGSERRLDLLLLCPKESVSTKACFESFDTKGKREKAGVTSRAIDAFVQGDLAALGESLHNDLCAPAKELCGEIGQAYEFLQSLSPLGVTMTGAGSCVLALFENEEFCRYAKSRYHGEALCLAVKTV